MPTWIGITLGDITGVGPEVALKALAAEIRSDDTHYLLIGDPEHTRSLNRRLGLDLAVQSYGGKGASGRILLCNPLAEPLPANLKPGAAAAALAAVAWLREGAQRGLRHEIDALVTAPVNKESIVRAGVKFIGQ